MLGRDLQPAEKAAPSDELLVARVCARDATAFGALYDRYAPAVYGLAAHMLGRGEADEVVQDVFLRLWQRAAQFDPARSAFGAWFMAIARHSTLDRLRRRDQARRVAAAGDVERLLAAAPDPALDPQTTVWLEDEACAVRRALAELPDDQRRVIVLGYFGGLSQSAMAQALGWPLGTVKKRVRLGMQKLRRALGGLAADEDGKLPSTTPAPAAPTARAKERQPVELGQGVRRG